MDSNSPVLSPDREPTGSNRPNSRAALRDGRSRLAEIAAAEPASDAPAANEERRQNSHPDPAAAEDPFATRESFAAWCEESSNAGDWYEAIQRWRRFQQVYPEDVWGLTKEAIALTNVGALAPALALLEAAERQFPQSEVVDLGFAEVAMCQRDYNRAASRWEKLRREHPEVPWGYNGGAALLLDANRLEEAEAMIEPALAAFPDDSTVLVNHARCAQQRGDAPEALSRWRKLIAAHADMVWGYLGEAEALIALGEAQGAQAAIKKIEARFPAVAARHVESLTAKIIESYKLPAGGSVPTTAVTSETAVPPAAPVTRDTQRKPEQTAAARPAALPPLRDLARIDSEASQIMQPWFDPNFYRSVYSDIRDPTIDPAEHYHFYGWKELRDPGPDFCTEHYLEAYPDAKRAAINPLVYHALVGLVLGHVPAKSPAVAMPETPASDLKRVPFDASAVTVSNPELRRFAFIGDHPLAPLSQTYDPAALDIHWVIPDYTPGAGGHMNIFRICNQLEARGHKLTIWIRDPSFHRNSAAARETLLRHFQTLSAAVRFVDDGFSEAAGDIIVATDAWSVPIVCSAWQFKRRFYFVQDFEAAFCPVGGRYLLAESTYHRDLDCICGGPWLERLMREKYGRWARKFWQAADPTVYVPAGEREPGSVARIAFYCRSFTDRRAVELGLLAFEVLARRGVAFHVDFFGDAKLPFASVPYSATNHGICEAPALAQIYQSADIGLVFSATNYSIVPQEMMACRLPVMDLDVESTRAIYDPDAVRLVSPDPREIADAIHGMLSDPDSRRAQAERAAAWVSQFSWSQSAGLVEAAFLERLAELGFKPAKPAIKRHRELFATVVIPTLDGGDLLKEVVERVLAQRVPGDLQLLCIDSASTDGTRKYLAAHPRVDLINIKRADFQHGRTRNVAVAAAKSEFVAFLTQDALPVDDSWLYTLVCSLLAHPRAGGAFGRHAPYPEVSPFIKRDINNHFAGFDDLPVCVSLDDPTIRAMFTRLSGRQKLHYYSDNNSCLRKSVWQSVPLPEIEFGEDQMFALELLKQGYGKVYARQAVVYHSHDDAPEIVEERSYTEAKFFYKHFGYQLVRSADDAARNLNWLNESDRRFARENAVPQVVLTRRLAQNKARLDGYLRAIREFRLVP